MWFYSKHKAVNFNNNVVSFNNFKSIKYKAKRVENTVLNGGNKILRNATMSVPLKCLSNFWKSLEMPLIKCKAELKLKWTKYYLLSAVVNDNLNDNDNNIINFIFYYINNFIFTIKDTIL